MSESLIGESLDAALTVKDLARSTAWYVGVFGFTESRRFEKDGALFAVSLQAGAVRILLSQDDGSKGLDRPRGEAISLQVTTKQNADELAAAIRARGGTLEGDLVTMRHGPRVFRLRDPDGFRFTVSATAG